MNKRKKYFRRPIKKIEDLRGRTQCLVCRRILLAIIIGVVLFLGVVCIDLNSNCKLEIYDTLENWFDVFPVVKEAIVKGWSDYTGLAVTLNTILATVVIFFYSVQDTKKSGVSHRAIMAYSKGSFAIPVLFFLTFITCPMMFLFYELGMKWSAFYCILVTYVIEVYISGLILISTSFQYNVHVLCNVEIRQFSALKELDENREEKQEKDGYKGNPLYVWTYLLHHIEDVIKSDELISDKLIVIKRLIRVPFYNKEFSLWRRVINIWGRYLGLTILDNKIKESFVEMLGDNNPERVYEFYYYNVLAVLESQEDMRADESEKFSMIIYEFIEELTEAYCIYRKSVSEPKRENYIVAVSGILNAVLYSNVEKSEDICITVFNNILSKNEELGDDYMNLLCLYILYQELLNTVKPDAVKTTKIDNIYRFQEWSFDEKKLNQYLYYWSVWMAFTTTSVVASRLKYNQIVRTVQGKEVSATLIFRLMEMKKRKEDKEEWWLEY